MTTISRRKQPHNVVAKCCMEIANNALTSEPDPNDRAGGAMALWVALRRASTLAAFRRATGWPSPAVPGRA